MQLPRLAFRRERRAASSSRSKTSRIPKRGFATRCGSRRIRSKTKGGLLWAYLGSAAGAAAFPTTSRSCGRTASCRSSFAKMPCNWLQGQENSIDPVHFEWMHRNWTRAAAQARRARTRKRHMQLGFDEFEHGFMYKRLIEGMPTRAHVRWTVGRIVLVAERALAPVDHFEWRVPIDDDEHAQRDLAFHARSERARAVRTDERSRHGTGRSATR